MLSLPFSPEFSVAVGWQEVMAMVPMRRMRGRRMRFKCLSFQSEFPKNKDDASIRAKLRREIMKIPQASLNSGWIEATSS